MATNLLIPMEQFSFFRPHDILHSSSFQCQKLHFNAPLPSKRSCCFMFYRRTICSHHHSASRFPTMGAGCAFSQDRVMTGLPGTRDLCGCVGKLFTSTSSSPHKDADLYFHLAAERQNNTVCKCGGMSISSATPTWCILN